MSDTVTVKVYINGTIYPVSCASGEEERLIKSSEEVNKAIDELSEVADGIGEARLLAMTSLILADKLIEKEIFSETSIVSDIKGDNDKQLEDLMNWLSKATERMNKVAKLLENK